MTHYRAKRDHRARVAERSQSIPTDDYILELRARFDRFERELQETNELLSQLRQLRSRINKVASGDPTAPDSTASDSLVDRMMQAIINAPASGSWEPEARACLHVMVDWLIEHRYHHAAEGLIQVLINTRS